MRRRRELSVFGLSLLDAMTCGLGAVVLLYMVINASTGVRAGKMTHELTAEVDRLEAEVLTGSQNLVELRNSIRDVDRERAVARGLSRRLLEALEEIRQELATYEESTLVKREHLERLKSDLRTLEEESRRLSASLPDEETPGEKVRAFVGDGDRQYLTGLKVGGERIFILVDASASMLDETLVNVILRRNLPDERKIRSEKWQQAVSTVDWLTTQLPRGSHFQIYTFRETAAPVVAGTEGRWLDAGDRRVLERGVEALRREVPRDGTSLLQGLQAMAAMKPRPDNLILLTDGLPTVGASRPRGGKVSGKERLKLYRRAVEELPAGIPVNVILFPMEGDPMAPSSFWKLALITRGSFLSPARDWP